MRWVVWGAVNPLHECCPCTEQWPAASKHFASLCTALCHYHDCMLPGALVQLVAEATKAYSLKPLALVRELTRFSMNQAGSGEGYLSKIATNKVSALPLLCRALHCHSLATLRTEQIADAHCPPWQRSIALV